MFKDGKDHMRVSLKRFKPDMTNLNPAPTEMPMNTGPAEAPPLSPAIKTFAQADLESQISVRRGEQDREDEPEQDGLYGELGDPRAVGNVHGRSVFGGFLGLGRGHHRAIKAAELGVLANGRTGQAARCPGFA